MPLHWQSLRALKGQSEASRHSLAVLKNTPGAGSSACKLQIELWVEIPTKRRELPTPGITKSMTMGDTSQLDGDRGWQEPRIQEEREKYLSK